MTEREREAHGIRDVVRNNEARVNQTEQPNPGGVCWKSESGYSTGAFTRL